MKTITLTPVQIRGLKLAKDGNLVAGEANKWTHRNATITYAKTDRFRERPQKIKFVTTSTLEALCEAGLLQSVESDGETSEVTYGITMAGKMWLLKNK